MLNDCRFLNSLRFVFTIGLFVLFSHTTIAQEDPELPPASSIVYIALDPDIVTNYAGDNSKKLGFLRLTIELVLSSPELIVDVEHHMPLLRAIAIEVIGGQSEHSVKSLTGRENIRKLILKRFRDIMLKESGKEAIKDIIFTKYLRQGG